ncbi:Uncharacterised protein [Bordetella pertussis]|nr:Uncharacterised protein [Bordetella pertussis]CFU11104.1 Uncharacterised protein [Bordetella pertussis]CFW48187.1 Uncharacterised protein [Bordetella pertussis]
MATPGPQKARPTCSFCGIHIDSRQFQSTIWSIRPLSEALTKRATSAPCAACSVRCSASSSSSSISVTRRWRGLNRSAWPRMP